MATPRGRRGIAARSIDIDLYGTTEADRAAGRWVAASEQLEAWVKAQQFHHTARLQGTERALYDERASAPDYITNGNAGPSAGGSGGSGSGGGGGGGASPTKPGFFKAIIAFLSPRAVGSTRFAPVVAELAPALPPLQFPELSKEGSAVTLHQAHQAHQLRLPHQHECSKTVDGTTPKLAALPPVLPPALPPALAEVVPRVRDVIEAAGYRADLLHACTVSHHLLGARGLTHTSRLLVVCADAFYLFGLQRRGPKLLRRVALGAIAQLLVLEANTQLAVVLGPRCDPISPGEMDELLTIRERGVDLDLDLDLDRDLDRDYEPHRAKAFFPAAAFPGCSNPLLMGVVGAFQRGYQSDQLASLRIEAQPSFFNPRSSFRRQSFPLRQVDSTRFGTHLAVRTYLPAGRKPRPLPRPQQCPMSLVVGSAT